MIRVAAIIVISLTAIFTKGYSQTNGFFQHETTDATCDQADGTVRIEALQGILTDYPLPYYIVLDKEGGPLSFYDMDTKQYVIDNLPPGVYNMSIWVDYENACKIDITFEISEAPVVIQSNIIYDCNLSKLDLHFFDVAGPYTVTWYKKSASGYTILPGWPKYGLSGSDGQEDLQNVTTAGTYMAEMTNVLCGGGFKEIKIDPCDCIDIQLMAYKNVSQCTYDDDVKNPQQNDACDGLLSINHVAGSSVIWSTGSTYPKIDGLCTGHYGVTVTKGSCIKYADFEVCCCDSNSSGNNNFTLCDPSGDPPAFDIYLSKKNPTTATSYDGNISITLSGISTSTHSYHWTGPGGYESYAKDPRNLGPGEYNITVTNGCTEIIKNITLYVCDDDDFDVPVEVIKACPGQNNGEIHILASPNIDVSWYELGIKAKVIKNLTPGIYKARITNTDTECYVLRSYTIGVAEGSTNVQVETPTTSCPEKPSATVSFTYTNLYQPLYNFILLNNTTNTFDKVGTIPYTDDNPATFTLENLGVGNYTMIFSSRCSGSASTVNFDIVGSYIEVSDYISYGCSEDNSIELETDGTNPPFTYQWNHGLNPEPSQFYLDRDTYTVTVTDDAGCSVVKTYELKSDVEIIEKINACHGRFDGSIKFRINNPNNQDVNVFYTEVACPDCPPIPVHGIHGNNSNPIIIELTELEGDKEYSLHFDVGTCYQKVSFTIGTEKSTRTFSRFEDLGDFRFLCIFDETCKGQTMEDNLITHATIKPAHEDPDNPCPGHAGVYGVFRNCGKTEFFCDSVKIHDKSFGVITLRVAEYIVMMRDVFGFDATLQSLPDPCAYITVCENRPYCLEGGGTFNLTGGHQAGVIPLPNGCFKIICESNWFLDPAPDIILCGTDFLPPYIPFAYDPGDPVRRCNVVTKNFAELIAFLPQMEEKYGDEFKNSTLYKQIQKYKNDPRRYCSTISYCKCSGPKELCTEDFEFLETNIEEVICGPLEPPIIDVTGTIAATCVPEGGSGIDGFPTVVYCYNQTCKCVGPVFLDLHDWKGFDGIGPKTTDNIVNIKTVEPTYFRGFSKALYDGLPMVSNLIVSDQKGNNYFQWADKNDWVLDQGLVSDLSFQDFKSGNGLMARKTGGVLELVHVDSSRNISTVLPVVTSGEVKVQTLEYVSGSYFIDIYHTSDLFINDITISNNSLPSISTLKITNSGYLEVTRSINGVIPEDYLTSNSNSLTFFNKNGGEINVGGTFSKLQNNTVYQVSNNREPNPVIAFTNDSGKILKMSLSATGDYGGILFSGNGKVETKNTNQELKENFLYFASVKYGAVQSVSELGYSAGIDTEMIALTTDVYGNNYLGLNYKNDVRLFGELTFKSEGGYDVLISKLNEDGKLLGIKNYTSPSDERISDMFWDADILHLGANMDGNTVFRKFGELIFFKPKPGNQGVLSMTSANDFINPLQKEVTAFRKTLPTDFIVNPNPGSSMIEVAFDSPIRETYYLTIHDVQGKNVFSTTLLLNQFDNRKFILNIAELKSGVYFIQVNNKQHTLATKKFIKI